MPDYKLPEVVGVIGAGTMGAGIAQVFATSGYSVLLFDVKKEALDKALLSIQKQLSVAVEKGKLNAINVEEILGRIKCLTELSHVKADLIIEAAVEIMAVKKQIFNTLIENNSDEAILVSNTSSLSITELASGLKNPQRISGLHFFNPAHLMKLVEIIQAAETSDLVVKILQDLCVKIGKTSVVCKDSPGFIVNRVARHFYVESLKMAEEKITDVKQMDELLESCGFKMGPFTLMDTIGNDINFAVTSSLYEAFHQDSKFRPSRIQEEKVKAGHFGKKTGKGFYQW